MLPVCTSVVLVAGLLQIPGSTRDDRHETSDEERTVEHPSGPPAVGRPAHEIAFISGIGCSSRIPGYTTAYGFNSVHGRALPIECNPRTTSGIHFVNPADLAQAILDPAAPNPFRLREERVLQQFYPALTETQGAAFNGRPWRGNLRHLFGCRDVSWSPRDPLPFLLMPLTSYQILRRTIFSGMTFGEAATFDIGWY